MPLNAFIKELWRTGHVAVRRDAAFTEKQVVELEDALIEIERSARGELPGQPPELDLEAAVWAALVLYRGCQLLVHRDLGADLIDTWLARPCPARPTPAAHYSVDLSFRFVPDLLALARHVSRPDPLVNALLGLARDWPLSSVGLSGVSEGGDMSFLDDATLLGLYADRVLERNDTTRLGDPRVRETVLAAIGGHPELAPAMAAYLDGTREAPGSPASS